ncbi:MAG: penicillin-binding protein 2 [Kiritimatiellae bacterium]|nr:penicillin-binding protein 2 [Kiritimatiellia bacterium]
MPTFSPFEREQFRVRLVLGGMVLAFAGLVFCLWRVQVVHGARYETSLNRQSMRRVRIPGGRGRILDRNGVSLADNRPSYGIAVYLEELRQPGRWEATVEKVERVVAHLSGAIGLEPQLNADDIRTHIRRRLPLPLLAWRDVGHDTLARLEESDSVPSSVGVYTEAVRIYPQGTLAAHIVGYIGRRDPPLDEEPYVYHYYLPEMEGKRGVERCLDETLRGKAGGRLIRVDVSGFRHHELKKYQLNPMCGRDVYLAIDVRMQRLAEDAIAGRPGAAVVLDPRNGEVLALASSPPFDPNRFIPAISAKGWQQLLDAADRPLFNRAVAGSYPPGSTFKPVVAMAALANGKASARTTYRCTGLLELGGIEFACWHAPGHGEVNIRQALEQSCNVLFYKLALDCGYPYVYHMAEALGFGSKTGIELDGESAGLLPDNAWTLRTQKHPWRPGDTCNIAIGQGYLTVTPVQMAVMTAAVANGGRVYKPRLVLGSAPDGTGPPHYRAWPAANDMNWSAETLDVVRGGMHDVIHGLHGTGRAAASSGFVMAGKTGTAEYGEKGRNKKRGWMIAFAPFEAPRYAVAIVLDDVESASVDVAPRMKALTTGLIRLAKDGRT